MSIVDKEAILKNLAVMAKFDPGVSSPFAAMRLRDACLYRSNPYGFLTTKGMSIDSETIYVSVDHFLDCLKAMPEPKVKLDLEAQPDPQKTPNLLVKSIESPFDSELRVRTVPFEQAFFAKHDLGVVAKVLNPQDFRNFSTKTFKVVSPPLLVGGRLLLSTPHGILMWTGPQNLSDVVLHPRDSFLKFISGGVDSLYITDSGYWAAESGPLAIYVRGHEMSANLHEMYSVAGEKIADLPAERLMQALGAAQALCDTNRSIEIDPVRGVATRNQYGNMQEFSLGHLTGWKGFSIFADTAKLISDAFSQTSEETAVLYKLDFPSYPTMRLTRGPWEINFKIIA